MRGYIFSTLVAASLLSTGAAYILFQKNTILREKNKSLTAQIQLLKDARKNDSRAYEVLQSLLAAENKRLTSKLLELAEITDEEGTQYLDSPVPTSVRRLFK